MAKRRKRSHHGRRRRRNPTNPRRHHRRRRNPETFAQRAGKLAAGAAVAVATAVGVTFGQAKLMPGSSVSLYGIPALAFLAGVGIARTMPTLGVGMALGSFAGFSLPLSTKLITATSGTTPAPATPAVTPAQAAGISRAFRSMRAVSMGRGYGAVNMGAVHTPYASYG